LSFERGVASPVATLLGDYARAQVHAFLLYRLVAFPDEYEPIKGASYGMAVLRFVPRAIWKNKPLNPKVAAGSAIQGYVGISERSKRQYGLAGEAMLNFSYYGIIPAFAVFGMFLGWFRKKLATMAPTDDRFFLLPLLIWACAFTVNMELDNIIFNVLRLGVLPFMVIYFASVKTPFVSSEL